MFVTRFYKRNLNSRIHTKNYIWKEVNLAAFLITESNAPGGTVWRQELWGSSHLVLEFQYLLYSDVSPESLWNSLVHGYWNWAFTFFFKGKETENFKKVSREDVLSIDQPNLVNGVLKHWHVCIRTVVLQNSFWFGRQVTEAKLPSTSTLCWA